MCDKKVSEPNETEPVHSGWRGESYCCRHWLRARTSNHRRVSLFALARNLCFPLSRVVCRRFHSLKKRRLTTTTTMSLSKRPIIVTELFTHFKLFFFYHIIVRWTLIFRVATSATFDSAYYACTHVRPQMRLGGDQRAHNKSLSLFSFNFFATQLSFVCFLFAL